MSEALTVHSLTPGDAPALQALYEAALDFALLSDGEPPAADAGLKTFSDVPPGHGVEQLALYGTRAVDGSLAATLQVLQGYPDASTWWIGLLLLAPATRGQGLGAALLRWLAQRARAAGITQLQLGVLEANPAGRAFWEREGFAWLRSTEPRPFGQRQHVVHVLRREL